MLKKLFTVITLSSTAFAAGNKKSDDFSQLKEAASTFNKCLVGKVVDSGVKYKTAFEECKTQYLKKFSKVPLTVEARTNSDNGFQIKLISGGSKNDAGFYELTSIAKVEPPPLECCSLHKSSIETFMEAKSKLGIAMELPIDNVTGCPAGFEEKKADGTTKCVRTCPFGQVPAGFTTGECVSCSDHFKKSYSGRYKFTKEKPPDLNRLIMKPDRAVCEDVHGCILGHEVWDERLGKCRYACEVGQTMVYEQEIPRCEFDPNHCEEERNYYQNGFEYSLPDWASNFKSVGCDVARIQNQLSTAAENDIYTNYDNCIAPGPSRTFGITSVNVWLFMVKQCSTQLRINEADFEQMVPMQRQDFFYPRKRTADELTGN